MRLTAKFLILSVLLALSHLASAQKDGNLPYSKLGIGEHYSAGSVRNMAMGGVGIGFADQRALNILNPATAAYNRLTMFDVAARYDYRQMESEATSEENQLGNLAYLRVSLPLSPKWSTVLNVSPYSLVSYNYNATGTVSGDPTASQNYRESGSGGLSKVAITNAVHLGDGLSAGLEMAYIFGNITRETSRQLVIGEQPVNDRIVTVEESNYDDFSLRGGLSLRRPFSEGADRFFTIGAVYESHFDISGKQRVLLEKRLPGLPNTFRSDTLSANDNTSFNLPSTIEVGFSIDNPGKWALGLDLGFTQWSDFSDLSGTGDLENSYHVAIGGEYIPDADAVTGYMKRVTYKAGLRFQRTPYSIRGQRFNDVGINFGFGMPVNKKAADVNLAFQIGERGTLDSSLIKEKYLNVIVGFTINDKWFRKRLIY